MWLIVLALLSLGIHQPIFAQTPATNAATVAAPPISASASADTPAPTIAPSITPIPTPTPNPVLALFQQYQNDYLFNRDQYQQAYLDYTNKKAVYTKYGTVSSHNDTIEATKKALITRNSTLKTYLRALRVKLDIYKDGDPTRTPKLQIEISKLESWLDEQNTIVTTLNNDDDIVDHAKAFQAKYVIFQQVAYSALVQSEFNMRQLTLNQLKNYIQDLQNDSTITTEGKQWLSSLVIKADNAQTNLNASQDVVTQASGENSYGSFNNFYPQAKAKLVTAAQYCTDTINDIRNILVKFSLAP